MNVEIMSRTAAGEWPNVLGRKGFQYGTHNSQAGGLGSALSVVHFFNIFLVTADKGSDWKTAWNVANE